MSKLKIIFIIVGIALLLTALSLFFKVDGALIGGVSNNAITRGFPGHFLESYRASEYSSNIASTNFLWLNFLCDLLLYIIVTFSVYYLVERGRKDKKWWLLAISFVLAVIWLIADAARSSQCVTGFPIAFNNVCGGESNITSGFIAFGAIFDILFWFCLSSVFVTVMDLLNSKKIGRW
jgi:hypothetical protein